MSKGPPNFSQNLGLMEKTRFVNISKTVQLSRHRSTNLSSRGLGTTHAPNPGSGCRAPTPKKNFQNFFFRNASKRVYGGILRSRKLRGGWGGNLGAGGRVIRRPVRPPGSFLAADFRICGSFTLFQGNLLPM